MPSKQVRRRIDRHSTVRHASVPKRQPASTKAFTACKPLDSARAVIEFLGLSYSEVGVEYGRLSGFKPISKQAVYKMLTLPRVNDAMLNTLGQLISNRLTRSCGVTVGVQMIQNSPLHVIPYIPCAACGELYPIDRPGVRHCPDCR
jgi:hypothetical protein